MGDPIPKLVRAVTNGTTANYKYDGLGRRVEKEVINVGTMVTRYVYDNEDILLELNGSNAITARYTHGPGIDEPLIMEKNSQSYYYHADGLGSITELTNQAGTLAQRYTYSSFGKIESQLDAGFLQPYTYTGREFDSETGLYYYRARYYDASVGRFLSNDPIGLSGGLNLYGYVGNRPTLFGDSLGLFVTGSYDHNRGTLTLVDRETGLQLTTGAGSFFSGDSKHLSVPNGVYDILQQGRKPQEYRLEPVDTPYGDDIHQRTGGNEFRLHRGNESWGCITTKSHDVWDVVKTFIDLTERSSVTVPSKSWKPWMPSTESLTWYGRINVTGSR